MQKWQASAQAHCRAPRRWSRAHRRRLAPPVLAIDNLHVHFVTEHGTVRAVEGLSYSVQPGEMVAIVGESGSGKSVSALAVMQLLPPNTARIIDGSIRFDGRELLDLDDEEMRQIRGRDIAMIFQEPMTSLNPVLTIGLQIMEPLTIHLEMSEAAARARAIELLTLVGITDPESRLAQYPAPAVGRHAPARDDRHRPRLQSQAADRRRADDGARRDHPGADPRADEGSVAPPRRRRRHHHAQSRHRRALRRPRERHVCRAPGRERPGRGVFAPPAASLCARPAGGRAAARSRPLAPSSRPSTARRRTCSTRPRAAASARAAASPSTRASSVPPAVEIEAGHLAACHRAAEIDALDPADARRTSLPRRRPMSRRHGEPILDIRRTSEVLPHRRRLPARAGTAGARRQRRDARRSSPARRSASSASRAAASPRSAAWCCGSTIRPAARSCFEGIDLARLERDEMIDVRKKMQVIFQDPYSSLNPRMTVGQIIAEPMHVHEHPAEGADPRPRRRAAAARRPLPLHGAALSARAVGRPAPARRHRPGAGGRAARDRLRRGRLGARRVDPGPGDQPARGPAAASSASPTCSSPTIWPWCATSRTSVAVMYLGRIVEYAPSDELFANPKHPYTQALLAAAPVPDPVIERTRPRTIIKGELPSPLNPPSGCVFHPRCPLATEDCKKAVPASPRTRRPDISSPAFTPDDRSARGASNQHPGRIRTQHGGNRQ